MDNLGVWNREKNQFLISTKIIANCLSNGGITCLGSEHRRYWSSSLKFYAIFPFHFVWKKKKELKEKKQYVRRNLMFSYVHKYCFTEVCRKRGQRFKSLLLAGFLFGELEQK